MTLSLWFSPEIDFMIPGLLHYCEHSPDIIWFGEARMFYQGINSLQQLGLQSSEGHAMVFGSLEEFSLCL